MDTRTRLIERALGLRKSANDNGAVGVPGQGLEQFSRAADELAGTQAGTELLASGNYSPKNLAEAEQMVDKQRRNEALTNNAKVRNEALAQEASGAGGPRESAWDKVKYWASTNKNSLLNTAGWAAGGAAGSWLLARLLGLKRNSRLMAMLLGGAIAAVPTAYNNGLTGKKTQV
jgi:hypothetical protein